MAEGIREGSDYPFQSGLSSTMSGAGDEAPTKRKLEDITASKREKRRREISFLSCGHGTGTIPATISRGGGIFEIPERNWEKMPDMPDSRLDHTTVALGTRIFVFGGCREVKPRLSTAPGSAPLQELSSNATSDRSSGTGSSHGVGSAPRQNEADAEDGVDMSRLLVFDTEARVWQFPQTHGTPPCPRRGHTCTVLENRIFDLRELDRFIIAGQCSTTHRFLNDVFIFDVDSFTWSCPASIQGHTTKGRRDHASGVLNSHIVFFGGWEQHHNQNGVFNTARVLRPSQPTGTFGRKRYNVSSESHPLALMNHSAVSNSKRELFVIGGAHGRDCLNDNVYKLLAPQDKNHNVRAQSLLVRGIGPCHRLWVACAQAQPLDDRSYFFGGAEVYPSRSTLQNDLYQLSIAPDGESCTWQLIPTSSPRPCERMKAAGAICGGYFYVMGGETDVSVGCGGALRDCWRINIEDMPETLSTLSLPSVVSLARGMSHLLDSGEHSDISFIVEGRKIPAHRGILLSQCDRFRALFSSGMADADCGEIVIEGHGFETFSAMLHYLYTRQNPPERLTADPGKCQELLALADEYLLTDLKEYCGRKLAESLQTDNAVEVLVTADRYNLLYLKEKTFEYILQEYSSVSETLAYRELLVNENPSLLSELNRLVGNRITQSVKLTPYH